MNTGLQSKKVMITGASGGIGRATAVMFASECAELILHYHTNEDSIKRLADELPGRGIAVKADLRDEAEVDGMFERILQEMGQIDALVANAGVWTSSAAPLHTMSLEQWRSTVEINLTGAFLTCRGFLRHLADAPRESASIVLVGSTSAMFGEAGHADYSAAKAGLVYGLTRSLKNEIIHLAPRGRVNAVCPGWTETPMVADGAADRKVMERAYTTMALRKIATPEDVASAIVFLSSDRLAGHLTGSMLPIAGGMEGRLVHPTSQTDRQTDRE